MEMTFEQWKEKYKPINVANDAVVPDNCVWAEHDNGSMRWITNGRKGRDITFIRVTEVPYEGIEDVFILIWGQWQDD